MFNRFSKGSNSGMPILAIVAVIGTLAGIGVIYQVVGSVGSQTGQDHDVRELVELGSAVENKCEDISGDTSSESVTPISIDIDLRSSGSIVKERDQFRLSYEGSSDETYSIPNESCAVVMCMPGEDCEEEPGESLNTGSYTVEISHDGETDEENLPKIVVDAFQ